MKNVVVIGGGTGTFVVLNAIRDKNYDITALITMADEGGSNKVLRDEFGLLPTSGVRLAMLALSKKGSLLRELFTYRFYKGRGIKGMTFGNLFLAAVTDIVGSQEEAIEQTCELLSVKGKILPISYDDVRLVAEYEDGSVIVGEHKIDEPEHDGRLRITKLFTRPKAKMSPKAKDAILRADAIILGPGDFYTNTIANLVIGGVSDAIMKSKAKLIFIVNLMTDYGESYNYKTSDYFKDLEQYLPSKRVNTVIINTDKKYPKGVIEKYKKEHSVPVVDDLNKNPLGGKVSIVREGVLLRKEIKPQKGDSLKRGIIRHDSKKLEKVLSKIIG